jgi:hypothetical protein
MGIVGLTPKGTIIRPISGSPWISQSPPEAGLRVRLGRLGQTTAQVPAVERAFAHVAGVRRDT